MIVLDTNVISELWKADPDTTVMTWLDRQVVETLYLAAITVAELQYGIECMPAGHKRATLAERLSQQVLPAFNGRILSFDLSAAKAYGSLMAEARRQGKAIGKADGYIAAIASSHAFSVATRDVSPFEAAGLAVINPWDSDRR